MPMHSKKPGCSGPDCGGCSSPNCMSKGGDVKKSGADILSEVEPSQPKAMPDKAKDAAMNAKKLPTDKEVAEGFSKQSRLRSQEREDHMAKKKKGFADGGEISGEMHVEPEDEGDGEMHEMMGSELMSAIEKKDPKMIMQALEACVLSCMNKGMDDGEE